MGELGELGQKIYDTCEEKGFHEPIDPHIGEVAVRLLLTISEICEAFEALRKYDDVGHDEEIADTIIRLLHYARYENVDADFEVNRKMEKNRSRPYKHGKRF